MTRSNTDEMQTTQPNHCASSRHLLDASRLPFAALALVGVFALFSLVGCAGSQSQRATSNGKPGQNAPHEERNPSQHPEQFR